MADRRTPRATVGLGVAIIVLSFLIFTFWGATLTGLVIGVIIVDAGMQAVGVSNQTRIYRLPAPLHSRLNTVYMVTYFAGGSLGSAAGVWAWRQWRWAGVCAVSLAALALAMIAYYLGRNSDS
jgi:predicted MFS family arabinose efflux permease